MKTLLLPGTEVQRAADILRGGGIVGIPTDTVYGLAAVPELDEAVERIYSVKGRPPDKALLLLLSDTAAMDRYCYAVPDAYRLAQAFWPGPLTIILKKRPAVSALVTSGGDTVGVRCPRSAVATDIIRLAGGAVAAPSANLSGHEAPTCAQGVLEQLDGLIDAVVDGGVCEDGTASTIVDLTGGRARILRRGAISLEQIHRVIGKDKTVRLGITGPTGAGKSTALSVLEQMGALTFDCDKVYHSLLAQNEELKARLEERFPGILRGGRIDTKLLGRIVFSDKAALEDLNHITGRFVRRRLEELEDEFCAGGGRLVAYDAIRLLEGKLSSRCDAIVGIVAPQELRMKRIMDREGISQEYALLRIAAQPGEDYYRERCDMIIESTFGDSGQFRAACRRQFEHLIDMIRDGEFVSGFRPV